MLTTDQSQPRIPTLTISWLPGAAWHESSMLGTWCALCNAGDDAEEELGSEDDARSSDEEFGGELYDTGEGRDVVANGEERLVNLHEPHLWQLDHASR